MSGRRAPECPPRVVQLLPADGWRAVLADDEGKPWSDPLVCWALVEFTDKEYGPRHDDIYVGAVRGAQQAIVGMQAGEYGVVDTAETNDNFLGYAPAGEDLAGFEGQARDYAERRKKREVQP